MDIHSSSTCACVAVRSCNGIVCPCAPVNRHMAFFTCNGGAATEGTVAALLRSNGSLCRRNYAMVGLAMQQTMERRCPARVVETSRGIGVAARGTERGLSRAERAARRRSRHMDWMRLMCALTLLWGRFEGQLYWPHGEGRPEVSPKSGA